MITNKYIAIKDNKIIMSVHTADGMAGMLASLRSIEYDEIREIPLESQDYSTGRDIRELKDHQLRPLSERVAEGLIAIPDGLVLDGESFRSMTLEERVNAGMEKLPARMKVIGDQIVLMTDEEIVASKQATQEQLDEERAIIEEEKLIQAEIRKLAIERLGKTLKVVKQ